MNLWAVALGYVLMGGIPLFVIPRLGGVMNPLSAKIYRAMFWSGSVGIAIAFGSFLFQLPDWIEGITITFLVLVVGGVSIQVATRLSKKR